jgi:hypothetical protein
MEVLTMTDSSSALQGPRSQGGGLVKRTCATCGALAEATYRRCHGCLMERTAADRAAAGLPPTVEGALRKVATFIEPVLARRAR